MLKAYIFRDWLFEWVCVVIAENIEEAEALAQKQFPWYFDWSEYEAKPLTKGFLCEGGGNG